MKDDPELICLLLGSNIAPKRHIAQAVSGLSLFFQILEWSNVWETPPVGSRGSNFLNAAMLVHTLQEPSILKSRILRPLEARLGRVRTVDKFAPRTIDIDIISKGNRSLDSNLWKFAHAAVPVAELLPDLCSPDSGERLENVARRLRQLQPIRLRNDMNLSSLLEKAPSLSAPDYEWVH